jgi:hypothetical protein
MSKLGNILLFAGSFAAGYFVGKDTVKDVVSTSRYEVVVQEDNHFLRSKELNKAWPLYDINDETYMGDVDHMVDGIKNMYNLRLEDLVDKR